MLDTTDPLLRDMTPEERGELAQSLFDALETALLILESLRGRADKRKRRRIDWASHPRIPKGALGFLDGDPDAGKTTVMLQIVAAASRGERWFPDQTNEPGPPVRVLYLSQEDDPNATLVPKLEAAGADMSRVFIRDNDLYLDSVEGRRQLQKLIQALGIGLVVIDTIFGYLSGNVDIFKGPKVREFTKPLVGMARRHNCAIILLRHLAKADYAKLIAQGQGSMDFIGNARFAMMAVVNPEDQTQRVIWHTKGNLARKAEPFGYTIETDPEYKQAVSRWTGPSELTPKVYEIILQSGYGIKRIAEAADFLFKVLALGPIPSSDLYQQGTDAGFSDDLLKLAGNYLGVSRKRLRGKYHTGLSDSMYLTMTARTSTLVTGHPDGRADQVEERAQELAQELARIFPAGLSRTEQNELFDGHISADELDDIAKRLCTATPPVATWRKVATGGAPRNELRWVPDDQDPMGDLTTTHRRS